MPQQNSNNRILFRYAGLGVQMLVMLGVATYAGLRIDRWIKFDFPIFVLILPLLLLIGMIIKIARETSKRNNEH